jgi:hypothetical protein
VTPSAIAAAASSAGFRRQGSGFLWVRHARRVVHVLAVDAAASSLEAGVFLPELAVTLRRREELTVIDQCQLRFAGRAWDPSRPDAGVAAVHEAARELDRVATLEDASALMDAHDELVRPAQPYVGELYRAAIAVLTGAPGVLWLAKAAATHLRDDPEWSSAAGHVYAMVATAE